MSTRNRSLLQTTLVEAADHRASALSLIAAADMSRMTEPLLAKAQVFATLSLSCEQRAANLMTAIEMGLDIPFSEIAAAS